MNYIEIKNFETNLQLA